MKEAPVSAGLQSLKPIDAKGDTDDERLRGDYAKALVKTIGHFEYHYMPGSPAEKALVSISRLNDLAYSDLQAFFKLVSPPTTIRYFLYDSLKQKVAVSGNPANAHADFATLSVHALYTDDVHAVGYHELAHLFATAAWGYPGTMLMAEGLAVSFDGDWWGKPLGYWGARLWREGKVPVLAELAGPPNGSYWTNHPGEAYPLSGNLFAFLRRRYSVDQLRHLYVSKLIAPEVQDILGTTLEQLERDWRAELASEAASVAGE